MAGRHALCGALALAALGLTPLGTTGAQERASLRPFSAEEQRALAEQAVGSDKLRALARGQRLRALRVFPEQVEKDGEPAVVAVAILVNYGTGEALRVRLDPGTRQVDDVVPLKGRPQSSSEEREEARDLLAKAKEAAPLMTAGARIEGGFVVDPPGGEPQGRYLEFHVVTADGRTFLAEAIVDLAGGRVAALRRAERKDGGA